MTWGDQQGQIIGLKKRERQAAAEQATLLRGIETIRRTMKRHIASDPDQLRRVVDWALEQLAAAIDGLDVVPLSRWPAGRR